MSFRGRTLAEAYDKQDDGPSGVPLPNRQKSMLRFFSRPMILTPSIARLTARLTHRLMPLLPLVWLAACGLQDDYRMTLDCKGTLETLSKKAHEPAETVSREESRRYGFALRELEGYTCHTWRKDKIACIRSVDDEDTYLHESVTIHRDAMTVEHVATIEKKKMSVVREESFQGTCSPISHSH